MLAIVSLLGVIANFNHISEAVRCQSCYNYNGLACISSPDCHGKYCLFEQIHRPNGVVSVRKACLNYGEYQYDDGTTITNLNQCIARNINTGLFYVLMCANDGCNSECATTSLVPQPASGKVKCYNCITYDGTDCQSNLCQGNYCTYERRIVSNQVILKKGCADLPTMLLDDSTAVEVVGECELRNTATSQSYVKICNDVDFCNNFCNGEVTIEPPQFTVNPQRQGTITCFECESFNGDCYSGQCTAQYCLYQRQRRQSSGTLYVKKSCTNARFVEYPDNTASMALNTCEIRTIGDIQFQVRVCDSENYCNTACSTENGQFISCYQCEALNQADCANGSCVGRYCLFARTQTSFGFQVKKSCTDTNELLYPDNGRYSSFGTCEYRRTGSVNFDYKLCNSSSYCNAACPTEALTTTRKTTTFQLNSSTWWNNYFIFDLASALILMSFCL